MKKLSLAITLVTAPLAFAEQPNLFHCFAKNDANYVVNYTTTSLTGKPTFSIQDGETNEVPGTGDNLLSLSSDQTPMGNFATALVTRRHIADAPSLFYSLLIPGIGMEPETLFSFDTILIKGYSGGFRPYPLAFQQVTEVVDMVCEAQIVDF